ncbi:MAG: ribosome small subunit-dependent GTPase A [Eubacteriaceae bacterium]
MFLTEKKIGKIVKGIGGFYYVKPPNSDSVIECKARGLLRHQNIKPTVGDEVIIISENPGEWMIDSIQTRKNIFIRPTVANVDIGLIVFALTNPNPNLFLLDKLLVSSEIENVEPVICFLKRDLVSLEKEEEMREIYSKTPYKQFYFSNEDRDTINEIAKVIGSKTAFMAGPSGVGKSTLANNFCEGQFMETGEISLKLKGGKHTTRHVELLKMKNGGFLLDTPGFSSFQIPDDVSPEDIKDYFPEFEGKKCRFKSCLHQNEPGCQVKKEVEENIISKVRYQHYIQILDAIKKEH